MRRPNKEALTYSYWEVSQAWHRPDRAARQLTVERALQQLSPIPELGPKCKVSRLALALVREIVHRQKEPAPTGRRVVPLKAS